MEPADSPGLAVPELRPGARVLTDLAHEEDDFICRDPRPQLLDRNAGGRRLELHARGLVDIAGAVCEFPSMCSFSRHSDAPGRERSARGIVSVGPVIVSREPRSPIRPLQ